MDVDSLACCTVFKGKENNGVVVIQCEDVDLDLEQSQLRG